MKNLLIAVCLVASVSAIAGESQVFEARITERKTFDYSSANGRTPMYVQAETLDGKCKFTIGLVGLQGDGYQLTGRVEQDQCFADANLYWSSVTASSQKVNGQSVLDSTAMIALQRR